MTNSKKHKNKIPIHKESTWSRVKSWMNTLLAYYSLTLAISALISMGLQSYLLEHYGVVHDAVVLPERITYQHESPKLLYGFEYKSTGYKTSSYIPDTAVNRIGEHLPIVFLEDYPGVSKPVFKFDKDIKFHTEGTVQYTAFSKFLLGFVEFTDDISFWNIFYILHLPDPRFGKISND
jgi:hypothetical protein